MINDIYELLKTILNKELRGNLTPTEYNLIAKQAQNEIYRGYFEDEARDKYKEKRGLSSKGYANLSLNQRQRIDQFSSKATLSFDSPDFVLPTDLYLIKDFGIDFNGTVVEEMEGQYIGFLGKSLAAPSEVFPIYEQTGNKITISPSTIQTGVTCRYLRKPLDPKWTYQIIGGVELFNPSSNDFQDFELHTSEFSNLVIVMASYFGLNLKEEVVIKYVTEKKQQQTAREEQ
mgnify:FL=1|tara:strand:- start:7035 stop:7727 length:693 start_codon:yes stop_codon:yes gene_type:complete